MPEYSYSTAQGRNEEQGLRELLGLCAEDVGGGPGPGWNRAVKAY